MNTAIEVYGTNKEIQEMANRFKTALRGGDKLSNNEVIALAQIAKITGLNPFIGELWYIPGKGPMIGIAGARRTWNEQSAKGGGWSHIEIIPCAPDEAGYTGDVKDLAAAFRAEAHDSGATAQYQKLFTETIKAMRESGSQTPFDDAKQICGPRPMWVGYGYSTVSETSRMNKTQLARKRAEADALKKCINVPFGVDVSAEYDTAPNNEIINAQVIDEAKRAEAHREKLLKRYNETLSEAYTIAVDTTGYDEIPQNATDDEIVQLGIELRTKIERAKEGK